MDEARQKPAPPEGDASGATGPGGRGANPQDTFTYAALEAALEAVAEPAFVLKLPDTLLFTNRLGRDALAREAEQVRAALRGGEGGPRLQRTRLVGHPDHELVVLRGKKDPVARAGSWARRFGLTPRQTSVLALVVEGRSNRAVAAQLTCSEKTIELHVSSLFSKCGCENRYELVARFWNDG